MAMHSRACAAARPYTQYAATDDTIACRSGVMGYAGGIISACCLVVNIVVVDSSAPTVSCSVSALAIAVSV